MKIERIRTGVKAFIVHEGKILVLKERVRRHGVETIIHDLPGGGIELGETLHEALIREVQEEVGLQIAIERPVGSWEFLIDNPEGGVHIVCLGFQCSLVGKPEIDLTRNPAQEDIFETFWATKEELMQSGEIFPKQDLQLTLANLQIPN